MTTSLGRLFQLFTFLSLKKWVLTANLNQFFFTFKLWPLILTFTSSSRKLLYLWVWYIMKTRDKLSGPSLYPLYPLMHQLIIWLSFYIMALFLISEMKCARTIVAICKTLWDYFNNFFVSLFASAFWEPKGPRRSLCQNHGGLFSQGIYAWICFIQTELTRLTCLCFQKTYTVQNNLAFHALFWFVCGYII